MNFGSFGSVSGGEMVLSAEKQRTLMRRLKDGQEPVPQEFGARWTTLEVGAIA